MRIETERLVIRDFDISDLLDLQEILGNAEAMKYLEEPYSIDRTDAFLREFCIGKRGAVAAVLKNCGKLIGYILFSEVSDGEFEMGWVFHPQFWRRGYAYEACNAVISFAAGNMNFCRIFAETIDTDRSVRLMEKLGMRFCGMDQNLYCYEWTKAES